MSDDPSAGRGSGQRKLAPAERDLVRLLLAKAGVLAAHHDDWLRSVEVTPMADGGMGSLRLSVDPGPFERVAEHPFHDADGVPVLATLLMSKAKEPAELDIFKADFSALIRLPGMPE